MRAFLYLFVLFTVFSCKTNHYLSEPIHACPNIGLQTNSNSKGILVASNYNLTSDTAYFDDCLKGLILNVEAKSEIEIVDEIYFVKSPSTAILKELEAKYNVDGLLLLIKLRVQKRCYDVESKKLYQIPIFHPRDKREYPQYYYGTKPWTNLYVKIYSRWEYHDFATGKSYEFSVENDNLFEFEQYVADIDLFLDEKYKILDPLFYRNGEIAAYNLVGYKY